MKPVPIPAKNLRFEICKKHCQIQMQKYNKILIIDDDSDDVEIFCEAIAEINPAIKCESAENGEEALRLLRNPFHDRPDFIFLDLNMPRMNGKQCLSELKKDPRLKDMPVVVYTTSKLDEDFQETARLGAMLFITKPTRLTKLVETITFVLTAHHDFASNPDKD